VRESCPSRRRPATIAALLAGLAALLAPAGPVAALPPGSTPRELELGEKAAHDVERAVQLVDDGKTLAKLQSMLDEIAVATPRPEIHYTPHIVATPVVNAFALPGGWVYVTTGLLDAVASDDELAGVLAHEVAHNVNQHAIKRMREAPRGLGLLQLAAIAAMIVGKSPELGIVANAAANSITAMVLQGGSIADEEQADADGIRYLTHTHYNPVGALTLHERMASTVGKLYEAEMGIYRTHPFSRDRVIAARKELQDLGIPILRRLVTDPPVPEAHPLPLGDETVTEVTYLDRRLLLLAGTDPERTKQLLSTIRWALDHEVEEKDVKIVPDPDGALFQPGDGPGFLFTSGDGRANGGTEVELAGNLREQLGTLLENERARIRANTVLY
jgi:Peptidase family M48